jgi:hypothetical protein
VTTETPLALRLADDLTKTVWPEEYAAEAAALDAALAQGEKT